MKSKGRSDYYNPIPTGLYPGAKTTFSRCQCSLRSGAGQRRRMTPLPNYARVGSTLLRLPLVPALPWSNLWRGLVQRVTIWEYPPRCCQPRGLLSQLQRFEFSHLFSKLIKVVNIYSYVLLNSCKDNSVRGTIS